jgi:hypothetical protein
MLPVRINKHDMTAASVSESASESEAVSASASASTAFEYSNSYSYNYSDESRQLLQPLLKGIRAKVDSSRNDRSSYWQDIRLKLVNELNSSSIGFLAHDVSLGLLADYAGVLHLDKVDEKKEFEATLDACGEEACLVACSRILVDLSSTKTAANDRFIPILPIVLRTIRRQPYLTLSLIEELEIAGDDEKLKNGSTFPVSPDERTDCMVLSQLLIRLPVLISNACHAQKLQLPSWAIRQVYLSRLIYCSLLASSSSSKKQQLLQRLILHMVQTGASASVAQGLWEYQNNSQRKQNKNKESILLVWDSFSTSRDRLALLDAVVEHCQEQYQPSDLSWKEDCETNMVPYLLQTCLPCLITRASLARQFTLSLLLSKPTEGTPRSNRMLAHALVHLMNQCPGEDIDSDNDSSGSDDSSHDDDEDDKLSATKMPVLVRCTRDIVVMHWATRQFIRHSSPLVQRRVTSFLRSSLAIFGSSSIRTCTGSLMEGVTARLESSQNAIRVDGMRIAELISQLLGDGAGIHFAELDDDDEEEELVAKEPEASAEEASSKTKPQTKTKRPTKRKNLDPDAEYDSSDSEEEEDGSLDASDGDDNNSLPWDEELIPLSTSEDDEIDLQETLKPMYLRECLELLQTPETHEFAASRHETGLLSVEALVRSQPLDLPDVAVPLARRLIQIEDKFGMENDDGNDTAFDEAVRGGLVALAATESVSVGDAVIDEFFSDLSFNRRMLSLYTLERAAQELSGADTLQEQRSKSKLPWLDLSDRTSGNQRLVPVQQEGTKTRRWGRLNHSNKTTITVVNRFASVAPRWFYNLIGRFMERRDDASLWGGANGARLLSHLLVTLSTFCECSSIQSQSLLSKDLLEFAWTFRVAEDATLRSAVLVAVASSLGSMDEATLVVALMGNKDLQAFISSALKSDPDPVCRRQAQIISKQVLRVLEQSYVARGGDDNQTSGNLLL